MLFVHRVAKTIRLLADNVLRALYEKTFWNLLLPLLLKLDYHDYIDNVSNRSEDVST